MTTNPTTITLSNQLPTSSAIREWENARDSLVMSLNQYLDSCCSLGISSLKEGTPPSDLVARIDSTLDTFHVTLSHQLARARSTLCQTRNRLVSSIHHFPEEVLSEIFAHVIYASPDPFVPIPMQANLIKMYRSVHTLLGVCTVWKNIILRHKAIWSVVPVIDSDLSPLVFKFNQATKLSLERSGNMDLHLAAIRADQWQRVTSLAGHTSRFRSVNVVAKAASAIWSVISPFLRHDQPLRLTDLSIKLPEERPVSTHPRDYDYLYRPGTLDSKDFCKLLGKLSVLRLYGALVGFNEVLFSSQLVELHIQKIAFGHDIELVKLLRALSSADQLRDLRLVSVTTFPNVTASTNATPKLLFPNLCRLLVQDMYSNTLQLVLTSIRSRSHHLTLSLTEKCSQVLRGGRSGPEEIDIEYIFELLSQVLVDTLLISGDEIDDHWLVCSDLEMMMCVMPDLKSLRMNYCDFDPDWCEALTRPQISSGNASRLSFPALESIHLSWARIWDEEAFKNMIASYSGSLQRLVLGAAAPIDPEGSEGLESLEGGEDIVLWLEENVPKFQLTENDYDPPEFEPPVWQLW